jgi:hypothetical protein
MQTVLLSNDWVRLTFLLALLKDAGIEAVVLDTHMSTLQGTAFAIPCRLAVPPEAYARALRILDQSGEL